MKKFFCDCCEKEMWIPWMTIQIDELSPYHYCRMCAERFLTAIKEMEEANEEEKETGE